MLVRFIVEYFRHPWELVFLLAHPSENSNMGTQPDCASIKRNKFHSRTLFNDIGSKNLKFMNR